MKLCALLIIPETSGIDRENDVIVGGVPVPCAVVNSAGWFTLQDKHKQQFVVEGIPAAYWPDGSAKWLHLCGAVSLRGGQDNEFELRPAEAPAAGLRIAQQQQSIEIVNDEYQIMLRSDDKAALSVSHGKREILSAPGVSAALELCDAGGSQQRHYALTFDNAPPQLIVESANRAVVRLAGKFGPAHNPLGELIVFVEVIYGQPQLRLQPVFIYLGNPDTDLVKSLNLTVHTPHCGPQAHYGFANEQGRGYWDVLQPYEGGPQWPQARQIQLGSSFYRTDKRVSPDSPWVKATEGQRSQGWCHLGSEGGGVTAAMRYFWQEYPRSLSVDAAQGTMQFGLVPTGSAPLDLRRYSRTIYGPPVYEYSSGEFPSETHGAGGIAKSSELMLHFHPPEAIAKEEAARRALFFNNPLRILPCPDYLAKTKVVGHLAPQRKSTFVETEEQLAQITNFMVSERKVRGWHGLMDFGDMMLAYYSDQDRWAFDDGGYAWINSEHLPDWGLWLQSLRCARSDWLEAAIAMSRHNRDVDMYHRGQFQGYGSRHNVNHWGCKDKEWRVSMPLAKRLHYYVTADPWTAEVMRATVRRFQSFERTAGYVSMTSVLAAIMVKCELDNQPQDWETLHNFVQLFAQTIRQDGEITSHIHADLATGQGKPVGEDVMTPRSYFVNKFGGQHTLVELAELLDCQALKEGIVRHADFIISATQTPANSEVLQRLGGSVRQYDYAQLSLDADESFRRKLLFAIQPFLALAWRHTGDQKYRDALHQSMILAQVDFEQKGGSGPLDEPSHQFLPDRTRRNKAMCHLGDILHLTPFGLAELE